MIDLWLSPLGIVLANEMNLNLQEIQKLDNSFVIIMIASNMKDKKLKKESKWNIDFANDGFKGEIILHIGHDDQAVGGLIRGDAHLV